MKSKLTIFFILIALTLSGCSLNIESAGTPSAMPFVITATLPPTSIPPASETPLPPLLSSQPMAPSATPVEGTSSTQINVRAEPSTVSSVLGIIPANTKVQIIGKDPGGNWWQILYKDGKGWVTAKYVTTTGKPEVPILGGGEANPNPGNSAIIQQQLNIRSGPGTSFNSIGTLKPQDVVSLTGKDANGAWLQIDFASGPDGKGWINAAFAQAKGVESLPIVTGSGEVVGTGTPVSTAPPPTPTIVPAPMDSDSAQSPAINITLAATGSKSFQYSSDVSSPDGDKEDWLQFVPYTQSILIDLTCTGNGTLTIELLQNNSPTQNSLTCGESKTIVTSAGAVYLIRITSSNGGSLIYTQYTIRVISMP